MEVALDDQLTPEDIADDPREARPHRRDEAVDLEDARDHRKHPHIAASQLAKKLGRETLPFKVDMRKLKKLGLTQSFEVGYEISPRGRAYLAAAPAKRRRAAK